MDFISKSDIFFFITSIAVIVLTVVFVVAAFYAIRALKNFYEISKVINMAIGNIRDTIKDVKERTKNNPFARRIFGAEEKKKNKKNHE